MESNTKVILRIIVCVIVILLISQSIQARDVIVGETEYCGAHYVLLTCIDMEILSVALPFIPDCCLWQQWWFVDQNTPILTITGTVGNTPYVNEGYVFADNDWNIHVKPNQEFEWALRNSENIENENGMIELEIMSSRKSIGGIPLDKYFPIGTKVTAKGWWVEDGASHGYKTELHPLIYMKSESENNINFIAGIDGTYRFRKPYSMISFQPVNEHFDVPLTPIGRTETFLWSTLSQQVPESTVWKEKFWFDHVLKLPDDDLSIPKTRAPFFLDFDKAAISVHIHSNLLSHPLYFGSFEKSNESLLEEHVDYIIERPASGVQLVRAMITARLKGLSDDMSNDGVQYPDRIAFSRWKYQASDTSKGVNHWYSKVIEGSTTPRQVQFQLLYSPALGWYDNEWLLDVVGSSDPQFYSPSYKIDKVGLIGPFRRTYIADQRKYIIKPSQMSLIIDERLEVVSPQNAPDEERVCTTGFEIEVDLAKIIPGIDITKHTWYIQRSLDSSGGPEDKTPHTIPVGGKLELDNAIFQIDANNPYKLSVSFNNLTWKSGSLGGLTPSDYTRFIVSADVSTALGEELRDSTNLLFLHLCPSKEIIGIERPPKTIPHPKSPPRVRIPPRPDIENVIASIVWLNKRGLMPKEPKWPNTALPADIIHEKVPGGFYPLGHPESWYGKLPLEGRKLADAYFKLLSGQKLSRDESYLIEKASREAKRLPLLRTSLLQTPRKIIKPSLPRKDIPRIFQIK